MNIIEKGKIRKTIITIFAIVACLFYLFCTPYKSVDILKDKNGIRKGTITSITVSVLGQNDVKSTDPKVINQWSRFLKKAKYKPNRIFVFDKNPNWIEITMADGRIYYFEKWPYFRVGTFLYQFDDSSTAQKLFDLVIRDPKGIHESTKKQFSKNAPRALSE